MPGVAAAPSASTSIAVPRSQLAAAPAFGRPEIGPALEVEPAVHAYVDGQQLGVALQHRPWHAATLRVLQHVARVGRLVVLGIAAQRCADVTITCDGSASRMAVPATEKLAGRLQEPLRMASAACPGTTLPGATRPSISTRNAPGSKA